jgi:uncharacterized membrane protein YqaE (UPF0057 family)
MDAREYLSRKGVGLDRDPERPNTLEEKAWERARGAGQKRPKAGTPHDWEEWERYHGDIAEDAQAIEQKIDKQAHRQAEQASASSKQGASVQHVTPPPPSKTSSPQPKAQPALSPAALPSGFKAAYIALAVLLPPLAVGLLGGRARNVVMAFVLTLLAWVPGAFYAVNYATTRLKRR